MLRILIPAEVSKHAARAMLGFHAGRHLANDLEERREDVGAAGSSSDATCCFGMTTMWMGQNGRVW